MAGGSFWSRNCLRSNQIFEWKRKFNGSRAGVPRHEKGKGPDHMSGRMSIPEIATRLSIGRIAVYTMLEQGVIPAVRLGRRWIVTRHAYEQWERTCGMRTGLQPGPEYKVT